MILGLAIALLPLGCASTPPTAGGIESAGVVHASYQPPAAAPVAPAPAPQPVKTGPIYAELAPEPALMPPPRPVKPQRLDPGASALVEALAASLPDQALSGGQGVIVSLRHLRNQSHSTAAEFDAFKRRLAGLLTRTAEARRITFAAAAEAQPDYELLGTAYLVTADGFDQWELYLRLTPAEESWTLWHAGGPVRVLRQARPGQPQVTRWPQ